MKGKPAVIVILLFVVAVILGIIIAAQRPGSTSRPTLLPTPTPSPTGAMPTPMGQQAEPPPSSFDPSKLTATERMTLNPPSNKATQAEKDRYFDAVVQLQQESARIDVTGCVVSPLVLKAKQGSTVEFTNDDAFVRSMSIAGEEFVRVPARGKGTAKIDMALGAYQYGCEGASGHVGVIRVVSSDSD